MDFGDRRLLYLVGATTTLVLCIWLHNRSTQHRRGSKTSTDHDSLPQRPLSNPTNRECVRLELVGGSGDDADKNVDIIAIHGLDTKSPDTWIWRSGDRQVNWLADSDMLPKQLPTARIFTCDWPAGLFKDQSTVEMTIKELATSLLHAIHTRPSAEAGRPVLFVASCLGGIILLQALVIAAQPKSRYVPVWKAVAGIVFLATPFRGTAFADIAWFAVSVLRIDGYLTSKVVTDLLQSVGEPTFFLGDLVSEFTKDWIQRPQAGLANHLATFYEIRKGNLWRKGLPSDLADWCQKPKLLVPKSSARLDIDVNPQLGLDRTHVQMNKFEGPDDPGFKDVVGMMKLILREGRPIDRADYWICHSCYNTNRLRIERLSGDLLPIGQCYINLAVIEKRGEKADRSWAESEAEMKGASGQASPFSLAARIKAETPAEPNQVELSAIFSERKDRNNHTIQPRRVLIRGRAGVGKTTLCKKIIYEFIHNKMWSPVFDRIFWVPLRRLKAWGNDRFNLEELFYREFLNDYKDPKQRDVLAQALCVEESTKTLYLLDGLDEVYRQWDRHTPGHEFLVKLLNKPNVIITSRPYAKLPEDVDAPDLELETIGFYPNQVEEYIRKTLHKVDDGSQVVDRKKVDEILAFLQGHSLLQSLVRIPIQLDALCSTWDKGSNRAKLDTMTALYRSIEIGLWKKDIRRLGKRYNEQEITQFDIQDALHGAIEGHVQRELQFVEVLAFTGLCNDTIDFDSSHLDKILRFFEQDHRLANSLPDLSFLRTSDSQPGDKAYHFIHLTYQEYFAARYFVRQWKAKKKIEYPLINSEDEEQLSLYIDKDHEVCTVNRPGELRKASFGDPSQYKELLDMVNKGRQLGVEQRRHGLWDAFVRDPEAHSSRA